MHVTPPLSSGTVDKAAPLHTTYPGLSAYRLHPGAENPAEVVLAAHWMRYNSPGQGYQGLLDVLLSPSTAGRHDRNHKATPGEQALAATLIQWLGSPVGSAFLRDVIEECPELARALGVRGR